jgi:hypothetical protein
MAILSATKTISAQKSLKSIHRDQRNAATEVDLQPQQVMHIDGDNRWRMILCQAGKVWITQSKDVEDYVLNEGDMFLVTLPGRIIIQALDEKATVEITHSLENKPYRGNLVAFS